MKIKFFFTIIFAICLTVASTLIAQPFKYNTLQDQLPMDPTVRAGKLTNGIHYYIKANKKPENRAEMRLAVNAGATLEDEDQNGIAHLVEHMAFNGTSHFPKNDLINFLESIGMSFGGDLNAYTDYEETVYMIKCPTDSMELFDKSMLVLEDWAHNLSFEPKEVDKEKGVVIEEYRLGKGAEDRVWKKHEKVFYKDTRFAIRDVIGDTTIIRRATANTVKRFYNHWYRTDLMSVIVVGDFDVDKVEAMIKNHFGSILETQQPRDRVKYELKDIKEPRISIVTDHELTHASIDICFLHPDRPENTFEGSRQNLLSRLYNYMLNERYNELTKKPNPPVINAMSSDSRYIGKRRNYDLEATVDDEKVMTGFETLLTEAFRVAKHGFTQTEFDRMKSEVQRSAERAAAEKNKTNSGVYANSLVSYVLKNTPFVDADFRLEMTNKFLPEITLKEVNDLAGLFLKPDNSVILISLPDRANPPTSEGILAKLKEIAAKDIPPYVDEVITKELFDKNPKAGKVSKEKKYSDIGVTEWKLSNNVRVVLKPTDFKNDEIMMSAFRFGGTSTAENEDYISATRAADIINNCGLGEFNDTELEKALSGKIVRVAPHINQLQEGLRGQASPKDLETMFQIINLYFTGVREDKDAYQAYFDKAKATIKTQGLSPERAFYDTVQYVLGSYNYRNRPMTEEILGELNYEKALEFYKTRFANANEFTFIFVGNFDIETIKPLVLKYISSLPSNPKKTETFVDREISTPKESLNKEVLKGVEQKSSVRLVFSGDFEWTPENRLAMTALNQVMNIRLRESIREDKSGTYGIGGGGMPSLYPKPEYTLSIGFGCNPSRTEELVKGVYDVLNDLIKNKQNETYIKKVKEILKRQYQTGIKENNFWTNYLQNYYVNNEDPESILTLPERYETISAEMVQDAASKYFNFNRVCKFVLLPQK